MHGNAQLNGPKKRRSVDDMVEGPLPKWRRHQHAIARVVVVTVAQTIGMAVTVVVAAAVVMTAHVLVAVARMRRRSIPVGKRAVRERAVVLVFSQHAFLATQSVATRMRSINLCLVHVWGRN